MTTYNRGTLIGGIVAAVLVGGVVSYFASPHPDGLEKTQEDLGAAEPVHVAIQTPPVVFEEYGVAGLPEFWSNAVAGVAGSLIVLGLLLGLGRLLRRPSPPQAPSAAPCETH
jgi:hypothetical protein